VQVLDTIDEERIDSLHARDEFFWLDVAGPSEEQVKHLAEQFGWHPLVVEDITEFGQRQKLDSYENYIYLVFYGARKTENEEPALTEVHLVISGSYIISFRHEGCHELEQLHERFVRRPEGSEQLVVYRVLDTLTDSFFPVLEAIDDSIDTLEDSIVTRPGDAELQKVFQLKRFLVVLRRIVTPQRDLAARTIDEIVDLPGLDPGQRDYFRDIYDHLIRVSDMIDSYRDLLTGVMDVYLSTVSNRLNGVMKQLTVIATIFLPLTFVTGFFGQNFGWLTGHITSFWVFAVYGLGGLLVPIVIMLVWFKRGGFLRKDV
jgi:magnesium transporter